MSDQACANIAKHDSQRAEREQAGIWRAVGGGGRAGCVNERVSCHGSRDPKVNNRNEAAGKGRTGNETNAMRMGLFKKTRQPDSRESGSPQPRSRANRRRFACEISLGDALHLMVVLTEGNRV